MIKGFAVDQKRDEMCFLPVIKPCAGQATMTPLQLSKLDVMKPHYYRRQ